MKGQVGKACSVHLSFQLLLYLMHVFSVSVTVSLRPNEKNELHISSFSEPNFIHESGVSFYDFHEFRHQPVTAIQDA